MYQPCGHFISDPPVIRLVWIFAQVKISMDTNFSESFMFISFAVLEKTAVEFEKKNRKRFFSRMSHFETMKDMNLILLFYESGMARLKFLHSRVLSKYRGSRNKTKNNGGGNFISDPPIVRLIWFFAKVKISTDTNFSESFMFISFAVLEKTAVEFEKKNRKRFFSRMSHFETMKDMNLILLFYESGMARLKFLHSRVLSKFRGSR